MGLEHPAVPIERMKPLVMKLVEETGLSHQALSRRCGVHHDTINQIVNGASTIKYVNGKKKVHQKKYVNFSVADKIITYGFRDPLLWWTELRDIYEQGVPLNPREREMVRDDSPVL